MMHIRIWMYTLILILSIGLSVMVACGDDDDDDDDDNDTTYEDGTCDGYCAKIFDCNAGAGFTDEAACADNCETMPLKDCFLTCDPSLSCGDFMSCLTACSSS